MVLEPDKDKLGGNAELHKASRQIVLNNLENHELTFVETCIQKKTNLPSSELDPVSILYIYIYVSPMLLLLNCTISVKTTRQLVAVLLVDTLYSSQ